MTDEPRGDGPKEEVASSNRTLFVIMGVVAAIFVIAGLAIGKDKPPVKPPPPPGNARGVSVPTDDAGRTIVVSPCGTDPEETASNAANGEPTPGAIEFELPRGDGVRGVLVPDCSPQAGVSNFRSGLPSAAFVLPEGNQADQLQVPPIRSAAQVIVPAASPARTVVVSPCTHETEGEGSEPSPEIEAGEGKDVVIAPEDGDGDLAVAAAC